MHRTAMTWPRRLFVAGWHFTPAIFPRALNWLSCVVESPWRRCQVACCCAGFLSCTSLLVSFMSIGEKTKRHSLNILQWLRRAEPAGRALLARPPLLEAWRCRSCACGAHKQLELDPGHPEANGELGAVLVAEDRAVEAIPHLELAIHSKPDLWPAYAQLGRAYAMEKNYARAEQVLKRGLAHDQDAATHYQLAMVLRVEGKTAEAAQAFAQVRAIKKEKIAPIPPATLRARGNPMRMRWQFACPAALLVLASSLGAQSALWTKA